MYNLETNKKQVERKKQQEQYREELKRLAEHKLANQKVEKQGTDIENIYFKSKLRSKTMLFIRRIK